MPLRDHFRSPVNDTHSWDEVHGGWNPAQRNEKGQLRGQSGRSCCNRNVAVCKITCKPLSRGSFLHSGIGRPLLRDPDVRLGPTNNPVHDSL